MIASLALMLMISTTDQQAAPARSQKPKLICVEDDVETGSHIHTGRRCQTEGEWQQESARRSQVPTTLRVGPGTGDPIPRPKRGPLD